jgi:excisionase family DNA binding protein
MKAMGIDASGDETSPDASMPVHTGHAILGSSDELLTGEEARNFLGISRTTLHRMLTQEQVKGMKVGGQWRFRKADLIAYMERRPTPITPGAIAEIEAEIAAIAQDLDGEALQWISTSPDSFHDKSGNDARYIIGQDTEKSTATTEAPLAEESYPGELRVRALLQCILARSLGSGASDIHLEAQPNGTLVRYREDGVLHTIRLLPKSLHEALIHQIKAISSMDINEKTLPQEGRFPIRYKTVELDARTATLPTQFGEAMTIRLLDRSAYRITPGLDNLGLALDDLQQLRGGWLRAPNGLVLLTGPVGSGTTTLAYSCLEALANPEIKVVTLEDPVEQVLPGVSQTPVNAEAGFTFATGTRALLKQDPDVIYVSDVPDTETAQALHSAALMGHLTLATFPAKGAAKAVVQLVEKGIEPFTINGCLLGVTHQRLVRRICTECREEAPAPKALLDHISRLSAAGGYEIPAQVTWMHGRGCAKCRNMGYRGRFMLIEMLSWNETLSEALLSCADEGELTELALRSGMKTLLADGMRKAVAGHTTPEEVLRVIALV